MDYLDLMRELSIEAETKILMLVIDGLGGLPIAKGGPTELEAAHTPNLDALAAQSICGLCIPVAPGITPGSAPGHLALFGYDPIRYRIGRGVLSALGIGFDLQPEDVAARGNFCTVDGEGKVIDRRAGRIPTEKGTELCNLLRKIELPGVEVFVEPVRGYRFMLVLRGDGLSGELSDTDPQRVGVKPLPISAGPGAERTAELVERWVEEARQLLAGHYPANMVLLRGFSKLPSIPTMEEVYKLKAGAIATYPMYKGLAKLVGMDILPSGETLEEEIQALKSNWDNYDFFYFHIKKTDSAGEDGDFDRKVSVIEHVDELLPQIMELGPDVLIVTGDHSTPAQLRSHSWHPVPTMLWSPHCRPDGVKGFGERACASGSLGRFPATDLMPLAMANALRLTKYGA